MTTKSLISILLLLQVVELYSQSFQKEIGFIEHLENLGEYKEGLLYMKQVEDRYIEPGTADSLAYYKGRFQYFLKNFDQSIAAFSQISGKSGYLSEYASFYSSLQFSYLGRYTKALEKVGQLDGLHRREGELKKLFIAGNHLLLRNSPAFDSMQSGFDLSFFQLKPHYEELRRLHEEIENHHSKSPLLAGVLSAIVPGTGKYYQGLIGQGTMALITTGVFGLQAYEGYRKDGVKSARFIIFSSLFSVFYVANIWGSVVSVRIQNRDFNNTIDESILVNLHIPLRNLYR